ncbi:MAG: methyl-accepting chemotaxis protein [Burkholderiales bacterium]|nr:methyl-accepting chemotaxis protein [Burkholderiales bacterium]
MGDFLKQFSIKAKISVLVVFAMLGMLALIGLSIVQMKKVYDAADFANTNVIPSLVVLDDLRDKFLKVRIASLKRLTAADDTSRKAAEDEMASLLQTVKGLGKKYEPLIADDTDRALLQHTMGLVDQYRSKVEPIAAETQAGHTDVADRLSVEARKIGGEITQSIDAHFDYNIKLGDKAAKDAVATKDLALVQSISIGIATIVVLTLLGFLIMRGIVNSLKHAGDALALISRGDFTGQINTVGQDEVAHMMRSVATTQAQLKETMAAIVQSAQAVAATAEELAAATDQVSASIEQQVNDTSNAAATVEQLTVSINHISDNAKVASEHAKEAGNQAQTGKQNVEGASQLVGQVNDRVARSASDMENLSNLAQQISSIATVIKEVADQTNLLALNAAIEAARAGEQGRGFAVVADEVRKLAERTTVSATEIGSMIDKIQNGAREAMDSMRSSRKVVLEVVDASQHAASTIGSVEFCTKQVVVTISDIADATNEQSQASINMAKRVEAIAQTSEENRATVESVAMSARELAQVAERLQRSMEQFKFA